MINYAGNVFVDGFADYCLLFCIYVSIDGICFRDYCMADWRGSCLQSGGMRNGYQ